jgi:hypothetical protein
MTFIKDFKSGQKIFTDNLAAIVNSILLTLVYFLGIGLTSIFAKIFRKHFLDTCPDSSKDSYWTELNLDNQPINNYYRQF